MYEGGRDAQGNKCGVGQSLFVNGDLYIGEYDNNKREGTGPFLFYVMGRSGFVHCPTSSFRTCPFLSIFSTNSHPFHLLVSIFPLHSKDKTLKSRAHSKVSLKRMRKVARGSSPQSICPSLLCRDVFLDLPGSHLQRCASI